MVVTVTAMAMAMVMVTEMETMEMAQEIMEMVMETTEMAQEIMEMVTTTDTETSTGSTTASQSGDLTGGLTTWLSLTGGTQKKRSTGDSCVSISSTFTSFRSGDGEILTIQCVLMTKTLHLLVIKRKS